MSTSFDRDFRRLKEQVEVLTGERGAAGRPERAVRLKELGTQSSGSVPTKLSQLQNDVGFVTASGAASAAPVQSVNGQKDDVELDASDVGADPAGTASSAVAAHTAAADPHPQYTTVSEAAAAAPVQSVNTKTGAVVLGASDVGAIAVTGTTNLSSSVNIYGRSSDDSIITISGGSSGSSTTGANMQFAGTSHPTAPGRMRISSGTGADIEIGLPAGQSLRPTTDNSRALGTPTNRWSELRAGNGTINTSDGREKTPVRPLTAAEIAAAIELGSEIGVYQWLAMIDQKGEAAREHVGMTVQRAIEIMRSHGLDPMRYGFICYDEWEELPEVRDEWPAKPQVVDDFGNLVSEAVEAGSEVVQEYRPAGNRYSFRHDELLLFMHAGEVAARKERDRRIAELESIVRGQNPGGAGT